MSGAKFVRLYPSDWRSGCIGLTLEQEGFYIRVCAFISDTGQRLPVDDDSAAAKLMGLHTNAYRKVRDQLVALGKIVERSGMWTVPRADKELALATANQDRGQDRQVDTITERNTTTDTLVDTPLDTPLDTHLESPPVFSLTVNEINGPLKSQYPVANKEEKTPLTPKGAGPTPLDALRAFEAYNAVALRCALPQAAKLTPDRQRKIIARLRDYGLDGWNRALANIEKSKFLTGGSDTGFRADLEFVLQAKSFGKLHDGAYGNGRHADATPPKGRMTVSELMRQKREAEAVA